MSTPARPPQRALRDTSGLMHDVAAIKRIRCADHDGSAAERLFAAAWSALIAGATESDLAQSTVAAALVAARLGPLTPQHLTALGVSAASRRAIEQRALAESGEVVAARFASGLALQWPCAPVPAFVGALCRQPRAGATRPGHARLVLLPAESHGDHCLLVAVGGVLLADTFGADPACVFLAGLAHHLHNARLPDSGFQGETLLGAEVPSLIGRLFDAELATLPPPLGQRCRTALSLTRDATTPEGRAFHAADVFDRVLQVRYHEAVAQFRATQALDDMELVHPGPLHPFLTETLRQAGLG